MPRTPQQFAGDPNGDEKAQKAYDTSRRNFLALVFCLMVGTAALPHILMRYYTTPSVKEARESVTWSLFFIFLLYFTAPALAVLVKYEVFTCWWARRSTSCRLDAALEQGRPLLSVVDINKRRHPAAQRDVDRRRHHRAGHAGNRRPALCHFGLVAAGGLAAALSTADGLLLTIANALSHDLYYKMIDPNASTGAPGDHLQVLLLVVALARPGGGAEAGGHPVPGVGGVLVRGGGVLPGADAGHLLEARQPAGRVAGHGSPAWASRSTTW
jgi:cation/acetate symporter